jgi:hypothetical protein
LAWWLDPGPALVSGDGRADSRGADGQACERRWISLVIPPSPVNHVAIIFDRSLTERSRVRFLFAEPNESHFEPQCILG